MRSLVVALVLLSAPQALADRLTVQRGDAGGSTVRDCYVWQESPNYNGNSDTLYVGLVGSTDKVTFLHFDVSALDPNTTVSEARLFLETYGTSGVEIEVHPVTADWTETSPTWGSFIGNVSATTLTRFRPIAGRNTVDLTAVVQEWVSTGQNLGIALRQATLTASSTFRSSESTPPSLRPVLEVLYTPPAPLVQAPLPALSASCGVPFRYPLRAHAPAVTQFSTSATDVTLDEATGELTWTPTRADRGAHSITVDLTDGKRTEPLALEIDVQCKVPLTVGCSSVALGPALLLGLGLLLRRRR